MQILKIENITAAPADMCVMFENPDNGKSFLRRAACLALCQNADGLQVILPVIPYWAGGGLVLADPEAENFKGIYFDKTEV